MLPRYVGAAALALLLLAPVALAQTPVSPTPPPPPPGFECAQPIEECFPDLLPTNPGATASDATEPVTVCTDFMNIGEAPTATPFRVTLYVDNAGIAERPFTKAYQRGEGEANVCVEGLHLAAGYHTLEVVVDSQNELVESDESNNRRAVRFYVGRIPQVDLELTSLKVLPLEGGRDMNQIFSVNVTNRGTAASNATTVELVDSNGLNVSMLVPPLAARKSIVLAHATRPDSRPPGLFIVRASVDPLGNNTEISERNNDAFAEYTILEHPMPDFVITNVELSGNTTEFRGLLANVTVQNVGDKTVRGNLVRAFNETNDTVAEGVSLSYMPPNSTNTLQMRIILRAGDRTIRLMADPHELASERNETNNDWTFHVTIHPPPIEIKGPNLVVKRIYAMPNDPRPNEAISVGALVQNIGNDRAAASIVNFTIDGEPVGYFDVPSLAPNASHSYYLPWRAGEDGVHLIAAQVDGSSKVVELDEGDNGLEHEFFVGIVEEPDEDDEPEVPTPVTPTPVTPTPVTPTPTTPRPTTPTPATPSGPRVVIGQVIVTTNPEPGALKGILSASLRNPSIQPLGLLTVQFKVGDQLIKEVLVSGIRGAATTVATTGEVDLPEGNNTVRAEVRIVGSTDAPIVREESYDAEAAPKEGVPGPAIAITLAAVAALAVLVRRKR